MSDVKHLTQGGISQPVEKKPIGDEKSFDFEELCAVVHKAYCDERLKQDKTPYWTGGDYNKLDEPTKDFDRVTVRAILSYLGLFKEMDEKNAGG